MAVAAPQLAAIPPLTAENATSFQYRSSGSISSGGLTIPSRNGHRRTLVDVFFEPKTAGIFLDITVGDRTFIRLPTQLGDYTTTPVTNDGVFMVGSENIKVSGKGFLWYLSNVVPFDFPTAAQDENITIVPSTPLSYGALPGTYVISAIYADQDSGDVVSKVVPGGSANQRRLYFNMMTNTSAQATVGQTPLDKVITPLALNGIKDNDLQTPGLKLTGYLFFYDASALGTTTGGNANGKPTRLHITDIDIELFQPETTEGTLLDRDLGNGLAFDPIIGNFFMPKDPYVFNQNRRFRFLLDTAQKAGTGANFAANTQLFGILGIREPVA